VIGVDLVTDPDKVNNVRIAARGALAYFINFFNDWSNPLPNGPTTTTAITSSPANPTGGSTNKKQNQFLWPLPGLTNSVPCQRCKGLGGVKFATAGEALWYYTMANAGWGTKDNAGHSSHSVDKGMVKFCKG